MLSLSPMYSGESTFLHQIQYTISQEFNVYFSHPFHLDLLFFHKGKGYSESVQMTKYDSKPYFVFFIHYLKS